MHNDAPDTQETVWITPADVAKMLGVSLSTVIRWANAGKLPVMVLPTGHRRFDKAQIEALLPSTYRTT